MIRGGTDSVCALTGATVHSPYKDHGLDLCQEAFEGPAQDEYACGLIYSNTMREVQTSQGDQSKTMWAHELVVSAEGIGLSARFTREGFMENFKKFFGKAELQSGDQTFDDNVFVHGDVNDERLAGFISKEGVQSALLLLVMANESATVTVSPGRVKLTCRRPHDERSVDHQEMALPLLALSLIHI